MSLPSPDRWKEVQRLFHEALEQPSAARAAWLASAAADDDALRGEVAALLAADAESDAVLDRPPPRLLGTLPTLVGSDADGAFSGLQVGPYRLERTIGRGGMGIVHLAHDTRTGDVVALKVLPPSIAEALAPGESRARFLREIRIGARVTHPSLVPVLDSGESNGQLWFVMPFVEGDTLRARLKRDRRLPVAYTASIGWQVAGALAWLADEKIVHRDVKPENVLVTQDAGGAPRAVLADFGVARALDLADIDGRLTATGVLIGTMRYMAPELIRGDVVTPAADVFGLGALLYEMLAGEPAFRGAAHRALLRATAEAPDLRTARDDVPAPIADAIRASLASQPQHRPTATELARVLAPFVAPTA